jgi:ketosteroid isomerase-like protein
MEAYNKQYKAREYTMTNHDSSDEAQIRELIENWAKAISSGDREAILAHHSSDLLMFDFPPHIVKGLDEYDKTWDFFFDSPKGPISFVPSDLQVTAGSDVGFVSCFIHCDGTSAGPLDLRFTAGLRKINGEWTIIHEHHSVPTAEERFLPSKNQ